MATAPCDDITVIIDPTVFTSVAVALGVQKKGV